MTCTIYCADDQFHILPGMVLSRGQCECCQTHGGWEFAIMWGPFSLVIEWGAHEA